MVLIPFLAFGELVPPDPAGWSTGAIATLAVVLLASDALLPVPSSVVLVLLGAQLGVLAGTLVGAAGLVLGTAVGLVTGRVLGAACRVSRPQPGAPLVVRTGWSPAVAVALLRGVPVLSETAAILAGVRKERFAPVLGWTIPMAFLLAGASSVAGRAGRTDQPGWLVVGVVAIPIAAALPAVVVVAWRRSRAADGAR